jgi:hypothetical protein
MGFICEKEVRIDTYDKIVFSIPVAKCFKFLQNYTHNNFPDNQQMVDIMDIIRKTLYYVGGLVFNLILLGFVLSYMGYVCYFQKDKEKRPSFYQYLKITQFNLER